MEGKKISFGFMKTKKQDKPVISEKKDYIECLEEKSIKVVGGEVVEEVKPLVIPMKANTLITAEKLKAIAEKVENFDEPVVVKEEKDEEMPHNESLDQMAVRELMEGAKKVKVEVTPVMVVPVNVKPVFEGQVEPTLDDYESVPIQDFGLAMLRGMGWTEGKEQSKYKQPQLRPKGLGLGADKLVKENQKNKSSKDEELSIVKNAFVKITSGKYSGFYGKVVSLDEDNGRVMVDIIMKKETVSLSEFMMMPVTKSEFDKQSKVINTESYEQYKKNEKFNTKQQNSSKTRDRKEISEGSSTKTSSDNKEHSQDSRREQRQSEYRRIDDNHSNGRSRRSRSRETRETVDKSKDRNRNSSSSEERSRHRKNNKKKYSSNESLSSDSDEKKKSVSRRRRSVSRSSGSSESHRVKEKKKNKEKKDIDKKRKGKKKKRDRDRSPNYRKHRK